MPPSSCKLSVSGKAHASSPLSRNPTPDQAANGALQSLFEGRRSLSQAWRWPTARSSEKGVNRQRRVDVAVSRGVMISGRASVPGQR